MRERRCDVVVVGAGLSGLRAALTLRATRRSVIVVEARDRVGGRAHTIALDDGTTIDLGGQWVGPTQREILATLSELGIATYGMHDSGANLLLRRGRTHRYGGSIPRGVGLRGLASVGLAMLRLDRMAKGVPLDAPWRAKDAARLDSYSLGAWADRHVGTAAARELLRVAGLSVWGCELSELSLLHALFYIHAAGGLDALISSRGGAQQDLIVGGAGGVAEAMAARLDDEALELSQPVRRMRQDDEGVLVEADALIVRAARAIVAIPPALAGRIDYAPALPARRDQLTQRMPHGAIIKCFAVYDRPFWRGAGMSGHAAIADSPPLAVTFDATPRRSTARTSAAASAETDAGPGVLVGFIGGRDARAWAARDTDDRRDAVIDAFARVFGREARAPRQYVDHDWTAEPYSRGCPVGLFPPGALTAFGEALRAPCGRIHWAGTETATVWNGYFDGAIQAGQRAAREVDQALADAPAD